MSPHSGHLGSCPRLKFYALFLACPFAIGFFTTPLPWASFSSLASALNAWAVIVTLWYSSTNKGQYDLQLIRYPTLTARYDNPDEVHEDKVKPEIVCFRSAVCQILVIVVEHARSIVENVAVYLT